MSKLLQITSMQEKVDLIDFISNKAYPREYTKNQKRALRRKSEKFEVIDGYLCYISSDGSKLRTVLSFEQEIINIILTDAHKNGHPGAKKMIDMIKKQYYGIQQSEIYDFVNACPACLRFNSLKTIQTIVAIPITAKYDRFMIDCVDLRVYSSENDGFGWLLQVIDTFTKYLWSIKMTNKSAQSVKTSLNYIFMNFGVPKEIQSDNGKEFKNNLLESFLNEKFIKIVHGRPRHPQSQGQIERANQTIKRFLGKELHERQSHRWIDIIDDINHTYNITIHRATKQSPFLLFHGQNGFNIPKHIENLDDDIAEPVISNEEKNELNGNIEIIVDSDEITRWNFTINIKSSDSETEDNIEFVHKNRDLFIHKTLYENESLALSPIPDDILIENGYFGNQDDLDCIKEQNSSIKKASAKCMREISSNENDLIIQNLALNDDKMETINQSVLNHHEKYKSKMIRDHDSNMLKRNLCVGDIVTIKKDFDTNVQTKKLPLDSFFENFNYRVTSFLSNNMVRIENLATEELLSISYGRLKITKTEKK